jgi:hypothetical protein
LTILTKLSCKAASSVRKKTLGTYLGFFRQDRTAGPTLAAAGSCLTFLPKAVSQNSKCRPLAIGFVVGRIVTTTFFCCTQAMKLRSEFVSLETFARTVRGPLLRNPARQPRKAACRKRSAVCEKSCAISVTISFGPRLAGESAVAGKASVAGGQTEPSH